MPSWDFSLLSWAIETTIDSFNSDSVSFLLSIISILMSFILTTATYLLWIWVPQIRTQSLSSKIRKDNIISDLDSLLNKKKNISKYMLLIYILTILSILTPIIAYIFWDDFPSILILLPLILLFIIFIVLINNIDNITKLSLQIDEQLLAIEKNN